MADTFAGLSTGYSRLSSSASRHLQQAGEKAVKGFLVFHDVPFAKIHDIAVLVTAAAQVLPEFGDYLEAAELLTPYVAIFRYPDEIVEVTPEEFEEALRAAQDLYTFVLSKLPAASHP